MESYGELLKKARENKNLSIEEVARSTTIARQYLVGLEEETDEVFPGEPYLVGFLKNYGDYLGLDSAHLLKLYDGKKKQEAPVPIELLQKKKPKFLLPLIIILVLLLLAGVGAYLYFFVFKVPQKQEEKKLLAAETKKIHKYEFTDQTQNWRLYQGDEILIPDGENKFITLVVDSTLGKLSLLTPPTSGGPVTDGSAASATERQIIELSEERHIDINGDGHGDLIVYLSDVSNTDESRGAEVRMLLSSGDESLVYIDETPAESKSSAEQLPLQSIPVQQSSDSSRQVVIHDDNRAYPFTLNISIQEPCLLRYRIDRKESVEEYLRTGETLSLQSNNGTRLWISNVNAAKINVIAGLSTYDLDPGRAGEVKVEDIKWVRNKDGRYALVVEEID